MSQRRPLALTVFVGGLLALAGPAGAAADPPGADADDVAAPRAATVAGGQYVALGDSFSAGVGTRDRADSCYRSPLGYPVLVAQAEGLALDYQACSGAVTGDVLDTQVAALGAETELVTMTIGGNDVGFVDVVLACGKPGWLADCQGAIDDGREILYGTLPGELDAVLAQIGTRAPDADVRVGAYPRLFNGEDCNVLTFFSAAEMAEINEATDELAGVVEQRTSAAGFGFVDPRSAFAGHAVCDDEEWVNGLTVPVVESFHPNVAGNVAYADLFAPGAAAMAPTAAPSPGLDRVQAEVDAVLAMDLASGDNLDRARAAGVDTERLAELVETLRSGDRDAQTAALADLQELDAAYTASVNR